MECYSSAISGWPKEFCALMMSAPVGADLMKAASWKQSNSLSYNSTYLNGYFGGWLEGNVVVGPDGKMKLIMRVEVPASVKEEVAIIDVSDDGTQISFNPETGFAQMPGGAKKFTIRYDEATERYWTLSNNEVTLKNEQGTTKIVKDAGMEILGAAFKELPDDVKKQLNLGYGLQVTGVSSGKMSDAGVRKGFIILKANDQPMRKVSDLEEVMKAAVKSPNQVLFLTGVFPSGKRGYFAVQYNTPRYRLYRQTA